jgi:hypothetical protein
MATKMQFGGFDEFLADLARLAPDFAAETARLEATIAEQTAEQLRAAYHVVTGRLQASVVVQRESSTSPARVFTRVAVTAPYANYYEFGTARTAPHPTFVPIVNRGRERFLKAVAALVRGEGLKVTGDVSG